MLADALVFGDQGGAGAFGVGDDQAVERIARPAFFQGLGSDFSKRLSQSHTRTWVST
jgi:hypothetical protein